MASIILSEKFSSIEAMGAAVGWSPDFRQLDCGRFDGSATVLADTGVMIMRFSLNRAFHQLGEPPAGARTFGFVAPGTRGVRWRGQAVDSDTLLVFDPSIGIDSVSPAGLQGYTISLSEDCFRACAGKLGIDIDDLNAAGPPGLNLAGRIQVQALRRTLDGLFARSARQPVLAGTGAASLGSSLSEKILALLDSRGPALERVARHTALNRLEPVREYVEANAADPIVIADLCDISGVSIATLERLFRQEFGVTPKRYITSIRLNHVRRALQDAPSGERIVDIAGRWGFWHMGQFARDYRRQFGQLPSQTLRARNGRG